MIYLIFKPKFLNPERFGPPSKFMLLVYYLFIICILVLLTLERLGLFRIEIIQIGWSDLQIFSDKNIIIPISIGIIAATLHTVIDYNSRKRSRLP